MLFKKKNKVSPDATNGVCDETPATENEVAVVEDVAENVVENDETNDDEKVVEKNENENDNVEESSKERDVLKKYENVNFSKMSQKKLFEVINELLIELKKTRYSLNKYDTENIEFYESQKKAKSEKKDVEGNILFLARKISPTYNQLNIENKTNNYAISEVIDMILKDHLMMQRELQEKILDLEKQKVLDKKMLNELKNQLGDQRNQTFLENKDNDSKDISDSDIEEFNDKVNITVEGSKTVYSSNESHVAIVAVDLDEARKTLGQTEWDIIEIMGKTGISLYPEILQKCIDEKNYTESKVKTAYARLESLKVIATDQVQTAKVKRGVRISDLTSEIGQLLYKEKFNTKPVESEKCRTIKDHGNLTHGYSIRETGIILESLGYTDVTTSRKTNGIHIGDNKYWIPDVIGTNPITGKKEYFEVEYGNHNTDNFDEKLTKANLKANILRFVVPSEIIKQKIKNKVEHWKAMQSKKTTSMTITICTIAELEQKSYGIELK